MSTMVKDLPFDFEEVLADADRNARTQWEYDFLTDLRVKHSQFGDRMYLSYPQRERLIQLAGWVQ